MSYSSTGAVSKTLIDLVELHLSTEAHETHTRLVVMDLRDLVKAGHLEAIPLLESLVSAGKVPALIALADLLQKGEGIERNRERARALLEEAADIGSIHAMIMLSSHHDSRDSPEHESPERSIFWLRKAADLHDETASYCLANKLVADRSVEQCTRDEVADIERLYEQSHFTSDAFYRLAMFHSKGKGSTDYGGQEFATAVRWLRKGKSRHEGGGKKCAEQLIAWGLESNKPAEPEKQKRFIWALIVIPISLVFWAFVGSGLLALANAINAITIPIIIVFAVVMGVMMLIKKKP